MKPEKQDQVVHRAGPAKQDNKKHKTGRHRSKGTLEILKKGILISKSPLEITIKNYIRLGRSAQNALKSKANHQLSRVERRNQAKVLRKTKTENILMEKRRSIKVPHLVAVIPLSNNVFISDKMSEMVDVLKKADVKLTTAIASEGYSYLWLVKQLFRIQNIYIQFKIDNYIFYRIDQFKQGFTFIRPDCSSILGLLDTLKVVDTILFMISADRGFDRDVDLLMTCILAQGLPSTVVAITDLDKIPLKVGLVINSIPRIFLITYNYFVETKRSKTVHSKRY